MKPTPDEADRLCTRCGGVAEPFGPFRQWFCINDDALFCLSCAREVIPDIVEVAEATALYFGAPPKDTN